MILRNETDFSNEELMDILHFVDPDNLMKQTGIVFITYRDTSKGNPYGEYVRQAKNGHQMITIYREKGEDKITAERHLILFLAHEFRHMWQRGFCSFLWDVSNRRIAKMAEQMQEEDAHAYDYEMLKIWVMNDDWNWKTLPDYKKEYLMALMC